MNGEFDVIVVGARCAGSPTAMLLARAGHRVLLVDRATFPSDTISTHFIHPPGVARLAAWGLFEALVATGCPPVSRYAYDFGDVSFSGSPRPVDGVGVGYGPRRTVLDALLLDAAAEAGAEVCQGVAVDEILFDNGQAVGIRGHGAGRTERVFRSRIVVGADGRHSTVAEHVRPASYRELPPLQVGYYTYWSGLPTDSFEIYVRPGRGFGAFPTHDGLTLVVAGWPYAELRANRRDVEGTYIRTLELVPAFAERVRAARREARFAGTHVASYFRVPYGPGWALVGDAGYERDPVTAWGISDAFRDATLCASGLHEWLTGSMPFGAAMARYQQARDEASIPTFELTSAFATLEPPPPAMLALFAALGQSPSDANDFVSAMAGTLPVPAFFAPANLERIVAGAAPAAVGATG